MAAKFDYFMCDDVKGFKFKENNITKMLFSYFIA